MRLKIGATTDLKQRYAALATHASLPPLIVATLVGSFGVESWLHQRFSRLRLHGEWFAVEDDLAKTVRLAQEIGPAATELICPEALQLDLEAERSRAEQYNQYADKRRRLAESARVSLVVPTYDEAEDMRARARRRENVDTIFQAYGQRYDRTVITDMIRLGNTQPTKRVFRRSRVRIGSLLRAK